MAGPVPSLARRAAGLFRLTAILGAAIAQVGCARPTSPPPSFTMPAAPSTATLVVRTGGPAAYHTSYLVPARWDSVTATLKRGGTVVATASAAVTPDPATQQRAATLSFPNLTPGDGYGLELRFEVARPGATPLVLGVASRDPLTLQPGANALTLDAQPQATPSAALDAPLGAYVESMPIAGPPAALTQSTAVTVGRNGDYFYLDEHALYHMYRNAQGGLTTAVLAGAPGQDGLGFVDGPGPQARFQYPSRLAVDDQGAVYVADGLNHAIRKVTLDAHGAATVTTVIGDGHEGAQDGGPGVGRLSSPAQLAFDTDGSLLIVDIGNNAIRRLTLQGVPTLSTIAGGMDALGYQDGDASVAGFDGLLGMAVDRSGRIFVSEWSLHIRMLTPKPAGGYTVSTIAGSGDFGGGDGPGASATFSFPSSVCVDADGNVLVLDIDAGVRRITPGAGGWTVSTIADGTEATIGDGPAMSTAYITGGAESMAVDADGSLLLGGGPMIQRVTRPGAPDSMAMRVAGHYGAGFNAGSVPGPTVDLSFAPSALAVDTADNVYALEGSTATVAMFPAGQPAGTFRTLTPLAPDPEANGLESPMTIRTAGLLTRDGLAFYYARNGQACLKRLTRDTLDATGTTVDVVAGGPSTSGFQDGPGPTARFVLPGPAVFAPDGSLYMADNNFIRRIELKVDGTTEVTTVAGRSNATNAGEGPASTASFGPILAMAFNRRGDLFVLDTARVHRLTFKADGTPDHVDVVVTGAISFGSSLVRLTAMAIDPEGHLYVADANRIFKLTHDDFGQWRPTQLAGSVAGYADGPVAQAKFEAINALAMDSGRHLYVADRGNGLVRCITLPPVTP